MLIIKEDLILPMLYEYVVDVEVTSSKHAIYFADKQEIISLSPNVSGYLCFD